MRPLRIIVTTVDAERLRGALVLACAQAALGGAAAIFLQLDAVALLHPPIAAPQDETHRTAGLPDLATLLTEAQALGVTISACQSGLALCAMTADALPPGVDVGGPLRFLQATGDDARLLLS
jgi:predicted peroxiredoxin